MTVKPPNDRFYHVCSGCSAKFFSEIAQIACPRCGVVSASTERMTPPWHGNKVDHSLRNSVLERTELMSGETKAVSAESFEGRAPLHEIARFNNGYLRLSIWVNEVGDNGGIAFSIKQSVRYRDRHGDYRTAAYASERQLLSLAKMYLDADSWCEQYRAQYFAKRGDTQ